MSRVETIKATRGEDFFVKSGRLGGKAKVKKGTAMLTKKERKLQASLAAKKRWENHIKK